MENIIKLTTDTVVSIDMEDSLLVERKFYEYNAGKDNIAFLMKESDINWEILQNYIDVVETRYVELELLKKEIITKYCPSNYINKKYTYEFLFETYEIKFSLVE